MSVNKRDIIVTIGGKLCNVTSIDAHEFKCKPDVTGFKVDGGGKYAVQVGTSKIFLLFNKFY